LESAGKYTIKANNDAGQTSCTCTLLVHEDDEDEYEVVSTGGQAGMSIPSFSRPLKSQVVKAGGSAILECTVDCQPSPAKITWLFKGASLVTSSNIVTSASEDGRQHKLTIVKVTAAEEGEYTVTAATDCAQISCTASVLIQPEATEQQMTVTSSSTVQKHSSSSTTTSGSAVGGISFSKYPESQVAKINSSASFVCHIQADTPPQVTWSKAGTDISSSDKFSLSAADNVYTLTINNAQESDSGEYKVVAASATARLSCTVTLLVTDADVVMVQEGEEESEEEDESEEESESEEEEEEEED